MAEDQGCLRVALSDAARWCFSPHDADRHRLQHGLEFGLALAKARFAFFQFEQCGVAFTHRAARGQTRHYLPCQRQQHIALRRCEAGPGFGVDDTQHAERDAVSRHERRSGIEADIRLSDDQRVVLGARIGGQVRHDQQAGVIEPMLANRLRQRGAVERAADPGLEPLRLVAHKGDERGGSVADLGGEHDDVVELRLGPAPDDAIPLQCGESCPRGGTIGRLDPGSRLGAVGQEPARTCIHDDRIDRGSSHRAVHHLGRRRFLDSRSRRALAGDCVGHGPEAGSCVAAAGMVVSRRTSFSS